MNRITELQEWITDWRNNLFSSSSRDEHGWPIEMHGVVDDAEKFMACLDVLRFHAEENCWCAFKNVDYPDEHTPSCLFVRAALGIEDENVGQENKTS